MLSIARKPGTRLADERVTAGPLLVEAALALAVIVALFPWFNRLATDDMGREQRFAAPAVEVRGLPDPVLPSLCSSHGGRATPTLRDRLCPRAESAAAPVDVGTLPRPLADARTVTRNAFMAP